MSRLVEVLYPLPARRGAPFAVVAWWEARRGLYNRVVGAAGVATLLGLTFITGGEFPLFEVGTWLGVGVYGLAANLCYSLGWGVELLGRAMWGREAPDLGPLLFREGLIFSVGVTLLPLLVATFVQLARLVLFVVG